MRTPTVALLALLLAAALIFVVAAPLAAADDVVIPINKDQYISDRITAHLTQVSVLGMPRTSDYNFAGNPEDYLWPTLVYYYKNTGTDAETGHITVVFTDDKGDTYRISDAGTLMSIDPGKRSEDRYIAVAIPKDRKVVRMTVIKGFDEYPYELTYPVATTTAGAKPSAAAATATGTQSASSTPSRLCLGSWALPLLIGGVVLGTGLKLRRH